MAGDSTVGCDADVSSIKAVITYKEGAAANRSVQVSAYWNSYQRFSNNDEG
jgi:hypothetical protein